MDFYDVMENRRTVRDFQPAAMDEETLRRILSAGMKAPSNDHLRDWHFIVLDDREIIEKVVKKIPKKVSEKRVDFILRSWRLKDECQQKMYTDAIPKQHQMLSGASCLIIPLFKQKKDLLKPKDLSALNAFASIWCCLENIFLAAAAEGYAHALRVPLGEEGEYVKSVLGFPDEYAMPCYLALGKPASDAVYSEQKPYDLEERIHKNGW